jgi:hypothetical protein
MHNFTFLTSLFVAIYDELKFSVHFILFLSAGSEIRIVALMIILFHSFDLHILFYEIFDS